MHMKINAMDKLHPAVGFLYFAAIIAFVLLFNSPVFLLISLCTCILYSLLLNGKKALRLNLCFALPMFIIISLINPLFSHMGFTILFYLGDSPITLESLAFGIASAMMLVSVLIWFSCYSRIITSDKFLFIFCRILPAFSLLFSMTMRLVPKMLDRVKRISAAQKALGMDMSTGNIWQRIRHGVKIVSILITWTLENAVETSDSMKARGYGLTGRSHFTIFRFDRRDAISLAAIIFLAACCAFSYTLGIGHMQYYPEITGGGSGFMLVLSALVYGILCLYPLLLEILEEMRWRRSSLRA